MSLQLYSKIPGTQVKRDANLSNAMVQCDPTALYPLGATQAGVPLNKENLAGKLGVEHDICNLDLNNLTVNGVLVANGPAEVCDIVCPVDFTVRAGNNIAMTATNVLNLAAETSINLIADDGASSADVNIVATRDITVTAARGLTLDSGSRGIIMSFLETTNTVNGSTSRLQITPLNIGPTFTNTQSPGGVGGGGTAITPGDVGTALGANGGAVQAVLTLTVEGVDFAGGNFGSGVGAGLAQGDVTQVFNYYNDKIVGSSNVLITYNSEGSSVTTGVHLDVQVTAVNAGLLQLRFINLGSVAQQVPARNVGFLNVLVINNTP